MPNSVTSYYVFAHIALAVYTRSPDALRSFKLLPLPCVWTLKYYMYIDSNLGEAVEVEKRLLEKKNEYDKLVCQHREQLEAQKAKNQEEKDADGICSSDVLPIGGCSVNSPASNST